MNTRIRLKGNQTPSKLDRLSIRRTIFNLSRSFLMLLSFMFGLTLQFTAFAQEQET